MFDTHAHVHDAVFDPDRDAMLARAREAGVHRITTIGTDLADSARAQATAIAFDLEYSIGIHPHEAADAPGDVYGELASLARATERGPLAIGEMGLDFYYTHSPREAQHRVLVEQLRFARDAALPAIFHVRDAFDEFADVLRANGGDPLPGVVHCFTGEPAHARTYVKEFGLFLGIGGVLTFKSAQNVRDAVVAVGLDHLILETDCPYLAPVPYRGKRNEPAFMTATAAKIAELLETSVEAVVERTTENAERLFGARLGSAAL